MKRRSWKVYLVLWGCLGLGSSLRGAVYPEALFQEAMVKETDERDLPGAVELYKHVIAAATSDHLLASKARLRLGSCYERLGKNADAIQVYLQIVTDTAETPSDVAHLAKENLHRLQPDEPGPDR